MVFMLFVQLATAFIVLLVSKRNAAAKWFIAFLLCGCLGDLHPIMRDSIVPLLHRNGYDALATFADKLHPYLYLLNLTFSPYTVLMFAVVYSERFSERTRSALVWLLGVPVLFIIATTPMVPVMKFDYAALLVWAGPYYAGACVLLFYAAAKEQIKNKRRSKIVIASLVSPPLLAYLLLDTIPNAYRQEETIDAIRYLPPLIGVVFALFLLFAIRYGVMGLRIRLEKQTFDHTYRAVAFGSGALNHMLKNRLSNMTLLIQSLQSSEAVKQDESAARAANDLLEELGRTDSMILRLHKQLDDIALNRQNTRLVPIVEEAMRSHGAWLKSNEIVLSATYLHDPELLCDALHVREVVGNLIRNAGDAAVPGSGRIDIVVTEYKRNAVIEVSDNGSGIAKNELNHIFELFYSTKNRERNFGLGLSYCNMVIQKHGGEIRVRSEEGRGSTFTVLLPKGKAKPAARPAKEEAVHGQHQRIRL